jgi:hypothetical protein
MKTKFDQSVLAAHEKEKKLSRFCSEQRVFPACMTTDGLLGKKPDFWRKYQSPAKWGKLTPKSVVLPMPSAWALWSHTDKRDEQVSPAMGVIAPASPVPALGYQYCWPFLALHNWRWIAMPVTDLANTLSDSTVNDCGTVLPYSIQI